MNNSQTGFHILNKEYDVDFQELDDSQRGPVFSEDADILIRAPAGSGKTKCAISAIAKYKYDHVNDRVCAITFTRAARAEMSARLNEMGLYDVEVTTIHVWARNMLEYFADKYGIKISIMTEKQIRDALQTVVDNYLLTSKARSVNMGILYTFVTGSKVMDITDNYRRTLSAIELRYIKYKRDNALYDFTDLPLYLHDILVTFDDYINTVDALFVDEFQDVDTIQFKVFERVNASKKFFIGDGWQCQPAGTQILTCSGANVPIEEIKPGMEVMLYRGEKMKVQEIQKHTYFDNYMIQITSASGKSSRYTANHRTFVRFNEKFSGYILYLTSDKNGVMKTAICRGAEFFNDCNGDRIWLIGVFDNKEDAVKAESKIESYERCLKECGLDINYPLIDARSFKSNGRFFETYCINLLPNIMSCLIIDEEDLLANDVITSVEKTFITKDNAVEVYALKVDGEIYVADGIVTHNSIYIFRSADGAVFSKLDNFTKFKLKYNYRSYQEIIDYATTVYETISGSDYDYGRETTITEVSYKLPSAVECNRGYGGVVSLINASGECIRMKEDEVNYGLSRCQILDEVFDGEDPMILCRSNKQVRAIQEEGYTNVSTVHQAKGLEYNRVIVVDMEIKEYEDLNVAYVALTRARDVLVVANWGYLVEYVKNRKYRQQMRRYYSYE